MEQLSPVLVAAPLARQELERDTPGAHRRTFGAPSPAGPALRPQCPPEQGRRQVVGRRFALSRFALPPAERTRTSVRRSERLTTCREANAAPRNPRRSPEPTVEWAIQRKEQHHHSHTLQTCSRRHHTATTENASLYAKKIVRPEDEHDPPPFALVKRPFRGPIVRTANRAACGRSRPSSQPFEVAGATR